MQQPVSLVRLFSPPGNKHRHVVIAVSGFLSKDSDYEGDWLHLLNFCKIKGVPLYCLNWEAKEASDLQALAQEKANSNNKLQEMFTNTKSCQNF